MCTDNWTSPPVCESTIEDILDCQDTYIKVRVFFFLLKILFIRQPINIEAIVIRTFSLKGECFCR